MTTIIVKNINRLSGPFTWGRNPQARKERSLPTIPHHRTWTVTGTGARYIGNGRHGDIGDNSAMAPFFP